MNTSAEYEAALAEAEAHWRRAQDEVLKAQTARDKANCEWDSLVSISHTQEVDRRRASPDRRRTNAARDLLTSNQRHTVSDRRKSQFDFLAFSKTIADRHKAYMASNDAEAAWIEAEANLIKADIERKRVAACPTK